MSTLFISLLTLILLLISGFVILLVLMQRTSQSGGMGAALGGGATESAFGSETNNVLTKATIYSIVAFFLVALGLFLIYQAKSADRMQTVNPEALIRAAEPDADKPNRTEALANPLDENLAGDPSEIEAEIEAFPAEALEASDVPTVEVETSAEEPAQTLE